MEEKNQTNTSGVTSEVANNKSTFSGKKIALGALTALAFAVMAGGSAFVYAQSTDSSGTFMDRVAQIAGVDSGKLKGAFKEASKEEVDQKVADGKLTQSQANEIKAKIENEEFRGPGFGGRMGMRGGKEMMKDKHAQVAEFLGMSQEELRSSIREDRKTLLTIAKEKGKTEDQLKSFLSTEFDENIAQAVKDGKITQTQADNMKSQKDTMISNMINGVKPHRGGMMR